MTTERFRRLERAFGELVALPAGERAAALAERAAEEPDLLERELGRGGSSTVYFARATDASGADPGADAPDAAPVALKLPTS